MWDIRCWREFSSVTVLSFHLLLPSMILGVSELDGITLLMPITMGALIIAYQESLVITVHEFKVIIECIVGGKRMLNILVDRTFIESEILWSR
ncbi:hypothetical protein SISNIDRAFT_62343 [Sistotremastrum niveocremeum HHB9708]|uniref:Uncharacterized protein n=2 Tax=Sistotremastraceae TaxID=3402574 RepID=A0A164VJK4_9AGAM|nr:hypothetical protein SISNIDRAFT_62343 [Sistotremastrum niveocremeum HHB9708]KZT39998.1 hypothetical protein SISSUDRAFT_555705 [Sistotremastrum suecicum HHB10207 ss-3]